MNESSSRMLDYKFAIHKIREIISSTLPNDECINRIQAILGEYGF